MTETKKKPTSKSNEKILAETVEEEGVGSANTHTLSTGVVIRTDAIAPDLFIKLQAHNPAPQPKTYFDEKIGRDMMESEDSEGYKQRIKAWDANRQELMIKLVLLKGIEVISVPKGFPTQEDDEWIDEMEFMELEVDRENPIWRRVNWLGSEVLKNSEDYDLVMKEVMAKTGVTEDDVAAADDFPERN